MIDTRIASLKIKIKEYIIPAWLRQLVYDSDPNRKFYFPYLVSGLFDIKPGYENKTGKIKKIYKNYYGRIPAFLHIPKTGGSSINTLVDQFPFVKLSHVVIRKHRTDKYVPTGLVPMKYNRINDCFIFSTVRNPLTFLVSYYHHARGLTPGHKNRKPFDYKLSLKGFDYFINEIINRTDRWPSKKFLFLQMFKEEGECIVDWVNRIETLDDDLKTLAKNFNYDIKLKVKERSSGIDNYKKFYSDTLLDKLSKIYNREMYLFGYKGFGTTDPVLKLKPFEKSRLSYNYLTDKIYLDGRLIETGI